MGVRQMPYQKGNGKPQYAGMGIGGSGSGGGSTYVLPKASADTLGGIKVGDRLSINSDGVLSASDQSYSLPTASSETLGGVKVGTGLSITDGVLSVTGGMGASKYDIATLQLTGSTNSTGSTITAGTYFYLNGSFVKAVTDIADGASFILNTNYETAVVGDVLSQLNNMCNDKGDWNFYPSIAFSESTYLDLFAIIPSLSSNLTVTNAQYWNTTTNWWESIDIVQHVPVVSHTGFQTKIVFTGLKLTTGFYFVQMSILIS